MCVIIINNSNIINNNINEIINENINVIMCNIIIV